MATTRAFNEKLILEIASDNYMPFRISVVTLFYKLRPQ